MHEFLAGGHPEMIGKLADLQHAALCNTKNGLSEYWRRKLEECRAKKCNATGNSIPARYYEELVSVALDGHAEDFIHTALRQRTTFRVPVWATLENGDLRR